MLLGEASQSFYFSATAGNRPNSRSSSPRPQLITRAIEVAVLQMIIRDDLLYITAMHVVPEVNLLEVLDLAPPGFEPPVEPMQMQELRTLSLPY